ncbi:hypothetical protein [Texcoconibacillus texcoconensis]|uniref:Zinc transporter ZupT n=1 Tax=Texcoconibacillus texcoconensis TaxID=1095777 RepID=A0A840QUX6_9BACI|nr:hypothetical protein [Texcoconibacillus texcoconensis]MBB5175103.1 zinc transporter ZupT [Texcoconibacillus texcoconensis]
MAVGILMIYMATYLFTYQFVPSDKVKRSMWISFVGGMAASYVFVYVLPYLHEYQHSIKEDYGRLATQTELYFIGLIGLIIFYGVQAYAYRSEQAQSHQEPAFWVQVIFFTMYNVLISYSIVSTDISEIQALFYASAIGLHFLVVAHDLWRYAPEKYISTGRYMMASGVLIGWVTGMWLQLSDLIEAIIFAFISGAMILNVISNELPKHREAHFPAFTIGVILYTSITMVLKLFFEW